MGPRQTLNVCIQWGTVHISKSPETSSPLVQSVVLSDEMTLLKILNFSLSFVV